VIRTASIRVALCLDIAALVSVSTGSTNAFRRRIALPITEIIAELYFYDIIDWASVCVAGLLLVAALGQIFTIGFIREIACVQLAAYIRKVFSRFPDVIEGAIFRSTLCSWITAHIPITCVSFIACVRCFAQPFIFTIHLSSHWIFYGIICWAGVCVAVLLLVAALGQIFTIGFTREIACCQLAAYIRKVFSRFPDVIERASFRITLCSWITAHIPISCISFIACVRRFAQPFIFTTHLSSHWIFYGIGICWAGVFVTVLLLVAAVGQIITRRPIACFPLAEYILKVISRFPDVIERAIFSTTLCSWITARIPIICISFIACVRRFAQSITRNFEDMTCWAGILHTGRPRVAASALVVFCIACALLALCIFHISFQNVGCHRAGGSRDCLPAGTFRFAAILLISVTVTVHVCRVAGAIGRTGVILEGVRTCIAGGIIARFFFPTASVQIILVVASFCCAQLVVVQEVVGLGANGFVASCLLLATCAFVTRIAYVFCTLLFNRLNQVIQYWAGFFRTIC
jgi:hypothetical protein